jgi:hypothetical protein
LLVYINDLPPTINTQFKPILFANNNNNDDDDTDDGDINNNGDNTDNNNNNNNDNDDNDDNNSNNNNISYPEIACFQNCTNDIFASLNKWIKVNKPRLNSNKTNFMKCHTWYDDETIAEV